MIRPASSGFHDVTIPESRPTTEDGIWHPRDFVILADRGEGIELWLAAQHLNRLPYAPPGTFLLFFWDIVVKTSTSTSMYRIDALPGARLSLPHSQITIRPSLAAGSDGLHFLEMIGLTTRFSWAASEGNGSRAGFPCTYTQYKGTLANGSTGTRSQPPFGAKAVTVKTNSVPVNTMQLREYSIVDSSTISTEPITNGEIKLSGLTGEVALINGHTSPVNYSFVFHMFL